MKISKGCCRIIAGLNIFELWSYDVLGHGEHELFFVMLRGQVYSVVGRGRSPTTSDDGIHLSSRMTKNNSTVRAEEYVH